MINENKYGLCFTQRSRSNREGLREGGHKSSSESLSLGGLTLSKN